MPPVSGMFLSGVVAVVDGRAVVVGRAVVALPPPPVAISVNA